MLISKRRAARRTLAQAVVASAVLSACSVGSIDDPHSWAGDPHAAGPNGAPGVGSAGLPPAFPTDGSGKTGPQTGATGGPNGTANCSVGPSPLRRLTHAEYNNSVRDLLGDTTQPGNQFVLDTLIGLFDNSAEAQTVPSVLADQYLDAATTLASSITNPTTLLGCDPKTGATCVKNFITDFGRRAYRRPLTSDESTNLFNVYTTANSAADSVTGVQAIVAAMLASPNFLFKPEFGGPASNFANAKRLSPFEQAARLSSLLWASVPDDTLLEAANANQLSTPAQVQAQARRMLADPKAKPAIADFYDQWLGLSMLDSATKDPTFYPNFSDDLRAAMTQERRQFIDYVIWQGDAKLETLLTANYSFLNGPLADLYGVAGGPRDATTFAKVMLDPSQRAGVMTQGAMLAAFARPDESSPVKRGKWVRTRMLCTDLPDPPANVPQLPAIQPGVSNRERFAMHTSNPACSGCHTLIDGLGFGLEHYDSVGAYRTMDEGVPVDASGEVTSTTDIDGPYMGGPQLASLLASSTQVRDCAPTQWLRYAWGRRETADDACSVAAVQQAFINSDGDLKELMVALTQTDTFVNYRQAD